MADFIQISTTTDNRDQAQTIASALVKEQLAACVQILSKPIISIYHWDNKIEETEEYLCLIKTIRSLYPSVESRIKELHSYKVPEIIAVDISAGSPEYLAWISNSTTMNNE